MGTKNIEEKIEATPVATISGSVAGIIALVYADISGFLVSIMDTNGQIVSRIVCITKRESFATAIKIVGY